MNTIKFTPLNAVKLTFTLLLVSYMLFSFNGPKERHPLYNEVETNVRQKSSNYAHLKAMICAPSDKALLGDNSIRCQVKFLDGSVATVLHKLDNKINSNLMNFKIDRTSAQTTNKAFDLNLGAYQSIPVAQLSALHFSSIIDSVYLTAQDKHKNGVVISY